MKSADRKRKRKQEIINASLEIFARRGYHAAGIADIAGLLGIGHGTIYRYFKSKEDILHAAVDLIIRDMTRMIVRERPEASQTLEEYSEQIDRIGHSFFELFRSDPRRALILLQEAPAVDESIRRKLQRSSEMSSLFIERYIRNGIGRGYLRLGIDVPIAARAVNAMMFEAIRQSLQESEQGLDDLYRRWTVTITQLMLSGMQRA